MDIIEKVEEFVDKVEDKVETEFDKLTGKAPTTEETPQTEEVVESAPVGAHTIVQSCFGRESADVPPIATTIATPKGA